MFGKKKKKEVTSVVSVKEDVVVDAPKGDTLNLPSLDAPVDPGEVSLEDVVAKNTDAWFKGEQLGYSHEIRNELVALREQNSQLSTQLSEIIKLLKEATK